MPVAYFTLNGKSYSAQLPEAEQAIVRARLGAKLFGNASSKAKQ